MSSTIPSTSLNQVYSRRLLVSGMDLNTPESGPALSDPDTPVPTSCLDADVVMILAVFLCALIFGLGLNSIVKCALLCSSQVGLEPESDHRTRLPATGARRKAIRALPITVYSPELKLNGSDSECVICLSGMNSGERVRVLPKCSHGFHVRCIDRWLMAQPSCPVCRQCLIVTGQKSSGCSNADPDNSGTGRTIIVPSEPEMLGNNYRGS
ncbi:RING-H2 finger protein ATL78-like [Asparagus officinalis]|uniref:RING-H2 finger protein ATL78-like n=1 Tax=Asparagus officinalis TaxID=4686 RepID=UPI00098E4D06|nr:RING-H2 finger protein ATL78-like [Asparagus officinalis]